MRYKLLALCLLASACGTPQTTRGTDATPVSTVPPTVWQNTTAILPAPTQLTEITEAAVATTPATAQRAEVQIQVSEPPPAPPLSPIDRVNSIEYFWGYPIPGMEAYRIVAASRGWSEDDIARWDDFFFQVMSRESAFCWNARAWSHGTWMGMPCTHGYDPNTGRYAHQGNRDDVGFGQITNILRTAGGGLCRDEGICSIQQTIATPWSSMTAFVKVVEDGGKQAWCYQGSTHRPRGYCQTQYPDVP